MRALVGRPVFSVASETYRWEDVVLAAHLRGDWKPFVDRCVAGERALQQLRDRGEDVPEDDLESASNEFRYDRNLLAADDLDAWLAERELDLDELEDSLRRTLLAPPAPTATRPSGLDSPELAESLRVDGICAGTLGGMADALAGRAAAHARLVAETPFPRSRSDRAAGARALRPVVLAPLGLAAGEMRDRAEHLACVERAYGVFTARVTTPGALEREIDAHRVDWSSFTFRSCRVGDENLARELALCVREDGQALEAAARGAGIEVLAESLLLADAPPDVKDVLLSARASELVGPLSGEEGFLLLQVVDRREASAEIEEVSDRAAREILERDVSREVGERVRWHHRL